MNDIGKELYERVRADFERRLAAEKHPPKDMRGVSDYSARVGRYLAEAIAANVTEDALPDRRLYYNIAESILEPSLRANYELVNDTAAEVQRLLDERQGLRIKPARADYPEERVHAVIGAASEEGIEFDRALRRMTSPAENITQSFADDFMQANAAQRSKAGFDTFIERQGGFNCCPWCAGLVGVFAYPKGLPKEVFARHDNCTCSVTYGTKGGARQHVWSKQTWSSEQEREYLRLRDEEKKKAGGKRLTEKQVAAIIAKVGSQPRKLTYKEALARGGFAQPRRLTGGANGGIIKSNPNPGYLLVTPQQQAPTTNGGSSAISNIQREKLLLFEMTFANDAIETAYILQSNGNVFVKTSDSKRNVHFSKNEVLLMNGGILSHNHSNGTTFSADDIRMLYVGRLSEIRACNSDGAFVMRLPDNIKRNHSIDYIKKYLHNAEIRHSKTLRDKFVNGEISLQEYDYTLQQLAVQDFAKAHRCDYFFERRM